MDFRPKDRGTYYTSFAFGSIVFACYGGVFTTDTFFAWSWLPVPSEWLMLASILLGMVYTLLGVLGDGFVDCRQGRYIWLYFFLQCALLTIIVVISPTRGFMGMLCLPVVSQSIFRLRWPGRVAVCGYLFALTVALWGIPYGWNSAFSAMISYSAGFAFTIAFTFITTQALAARAGSEKLRHELAEANAQLRAQAEQTAELATTRERNRVAREIHDGVGHYLTVIKTQLDAASALLPTQPERAREAVTKAAKLSAEALDDVRHSVGALRTDTGRPPLPEALRELAGHGDPVPTLTIEGEPRTLAPGVEHALYRAAQEGLTNIRKHARATHAQLRLDFRTPHTLRLELADNGIGTGPDADQTGFGLRGLRERIAVLGGKVESGNRREGGFQLRVEVPA
ncbi:Sensor histidine kinase LiaS [Lacunisphaera limnophila]|uniref:histidine kinase n=1 Tax=Lacunisphaera limnophila TaxID=1838286 RepID=A0A1I7PI37_9BACT|nr:sensor histidine kinase [Lacunisphaera limnophila]AOS43292.1 Sensor histidine kinase LiaS [Lacunisphaera limnophila]